MRNSKGFSLIEVMIASSIMAVVIYSIMHTTQRMAQMEKRMLNLGDMQDLISRVRFTLSDTVACNKSFKESFHNDMMDPKGTFETLLDRNGREILAQGMRFNGINVGELTYELEDPKSLIKNKGGVTLAKLHIPLKGNSSNGISKTYHLSLALEFDKAYSTEAGNRFHFAACQSLSTPIAAEVVNETMKRMCASMGVPYDPVAGTCKMDIASLMTSQSPQPTQIAQPKTAPTKPSTKNEPVTPQTPSFDPKNVQKLLELFQGKLLNQ